MAFWTTGFEVGDTAYYRDEVGWTFTGNTTAVTNAAASVHQSLTGKGGSYGLFIEDNAITPTFGTGGRWLHFWVGPINNLGDYLAIVFRRLDGDQVTVRFEPTGAIFVRRGGVTGTIISGGDGTYNPDVPHWVAIELDALNSGGFLNVYVDGVQRVNVPSDDLVNTPTEGWDAVTFDANANGNYSIDDIIVTTAAEGQLGEHFLVSMIPNGNDLINSGPGSTGGAGTFANVDELPPDGDTSYNEFTAPGTDRYNTTNLGYAPASIHSVTVINYATRDGTIDQMQSVCATDTSGGGVTEALGQVVGTPSGSYAPWISIFNTDPDTAAAWTSAGLDDLRIGIQFS